MKQPQVDYRKSFSRSGEEVEVVSYYDIDKRRPTLTGAPNHSETIEKVTKILRGTGISKITITFLDRNLE